MCNGTFRGGGEGGCYKQHSSLTRLYSKHVTSNLRLPADKTVLLLKFRIVHVIVVKRDEGGSKGNVNLPVEALQSTNCETYRMSQ